MLWAFRGSAASLGFGRMHAHSLAALYADSAAASWDANAAPSFTSTYPPASPPWLHRSRRRRTLRWLLSRS